MSIQSEMDRIRGNVQDTLGVIADTGVAVPEGANSDAMPAAARALADEKQNKLTGAAGQIVGFDAQGQAQAQDAGPLKRVGGTYTLTAAGWTASTPYAYEQTVTVPGATADDAQLIDVDVDLSLTDKDANDAMLAAYALVAQCPARQNAGSLTFYAADLPDVAVSLQIGVGG